MSCVFCGQPTCVSIEVAPFLSLFFAASVSSGSRFSHRHVSQGLSYPACAIRLTDLLVHGPIIINCLSDTVVVVDPTPSTIMGEGSYIQGMVLEGLFFFVFLPQTGAVCTTQSEENS